MKITAIKQQVKNPERVSIFLDGKYEFSLSLDELIKYKVKNGDELSKEDTKKFQKISADGKLRARSLEWLLNRPHSVREFKDYLYRKKAELSLIESLVEEFLAKGYLDEQKYSVWLVDLLKRRGKSDRAIKSELFKKGIVREIVEEVLASDEADETKRLAEVIAKKSKLSRYKADKTKFARYLVGQGFSWELVKKQIDELDSQA